MNTATLLSPATASAQSELLKEARMGAMGSENAVREIRRISLADYENRKAQIADELWSAAVDVGFFQIIDHGIDLAKVRENAKVVHGDKSGILLNAQLEKYAPKPEATEPLVTPLPVRPAKKAKAEVAA